MRFSRTVLIGIVACVALTTSVEARNFTFGRIGSLGRNSPDSTPKEFSFGSIDSLGRNDDAPTEHFTFGERIGRTEGGSNVDWRSRFSFGHFGTLGRNELYTSSSYSRSSYSRSSFSRSSSSRSSLSSSSRTSSSRSSSSRSSSSSSSSSNLSGDYTVLGWVPYWDQENAFESFRENEELFGYLSFFWYHLDPDGTVDTYEEADEDESLLREAQEKGVKVFALVANLLDDDEGGGGEDDWDTARVRTAIGTSSARSRHVEELVSLAERHNFDGINIDYEALEESQRESFTAFIDELGSELHARGKLLAVALHPKTAENLPEETNGSEAQDWVAIAESADQLQIMTYGEHYTEGEPGPIASRDWVRRVLRYGTNTLRLPKEKIFVGIPFYAEIWRIRGENVYRGVREETTLRDAEDLREEQGATLEYSFTAASPHFEYETSDPHTVWLEDKRSIKSKLALARSLGLSNIAIWRLGAETEDIWEAFER